MEKKMKNTFNSRQDVEQYISENVSCVDLYLYNVSGDVDELTDRAANNMLKFLEEINYNYGDELDEISDEIFWKFFEE